MKRVVVTGATSMIGIALINECIKNEIEVLAIVRKQSKHTTRLPKSDLLKVLECDLNELDIVEKDEKCYDVFYHFAWDHTSKSTRDNPILQELNIKYTLDAVDLARRLGCQKFIGAGSQAEYGKVDSVITPATNCRPQIAYGMAKYAAGMLSRKLCEQYGIIHIWGRIFSVYGKYDNEETMLTYAINQFINGKPAIFSAATQLWDYLHEEDAGKMFCLIGQHVQRSRVYCVASGESRPLKEFILEMQSAFGAEAICEFAEETGNNNVISLQADISTLIEDIGYSPQVTFAEGISDVIRFKKRKVKNGICGETGEAYNVCNTEEL